jgi:hypothetical protein
MTPLERVLALLIHKRTSFLLTLTDQLFLCNTTSKLPSTSSWEPQTLLLLIEAVLDYFDGFYDHCQSAQSTGHIFEHATREELYTLLLTWLRRDAENKRWQVPAETVAQIVSWGIFGAAVKWSQEAHAKSKRQMTQDIFQVINEGTMHFFTKAVSA